MNAQQLIDILTSVMYIIVELSLPVLSVALIVGLLVSIFQAATQINESTLSFLPKIASILVVLLILAPWMIRKMDDFTHEIYKKIPEIGRQK